MKVYSASPFKMDRHLASLASAKPIRDCLRYGGAGQELFFEEQNIPSKQYLIHLLCEEE